MNEKEFNHLFLIGHIGAGKTYHSKILKDKLDMPFFNIDTFRFIKSEKVLKSRIKELEADIRILQENKNSKLMRFLSIGNDADDKIDAKQKALERTKKQLKLRQLAPHARNLYELGYDKNFYNSLGDNFYLIDKQKIALLYNQFFLNKMTNEILRDLKQPCIIDTSGGQFINYDYVKEIKAIYRSYLKKNNLESSIENFPEPLKLLYTRYKSEEDTYERNRAFSSIKSIGNVVYFYQGKDLFTERNKASGMYVNLMITRDEYKEETIKELNPLFIDTSGEFNELDVDQKRVDKDIEEIVDYYNRRK